MKDITTTMRKKKTGKKNSMPKDLGTVILNLFKRTPKKRYNAKQVLKSLRIPMNFNDMNDQLEKLRDQGKILQLKNGKFKFNKELKVKKAGSTAEGRVDMTRRGSAFIICDGLEMDIHVPPSKMSNAVNGDTVMVKYSHPPGKKRPEGKIIKVIERANTSFIGTINVSPKFAHVEPDNDKINVHIFVPSESINGAKDGEKVIVKVLQWHGGKNKNPVGEVNTVLGEAGSNDIEMKSILLKEGFDLEFPPEVLREAEELNKEITQDEIERRRDMRPITTVTIDPLTAKDFDDALSLEYKSDGSFEIGVHIADVTHYLREGTLLDKEAYKRSTSVYLVDRVSPMLPEELSNDLCSLNPKEDKLTFSAVFTFNKDDQIIDRWFGKTIIHSDRRFTYEEAQERLEKGKGDFAKELRKMDSVAKTLRKAKFKNGAINFDAPEVKFELNDDAEPISVFVKERKDAHLLVEDFMLLANREVATKIYTNKHGAPIPFVYRVHDRPDEEKISEFANFAAEMGYKLKMTTPAQIAKAFNKMVKESQKNPELKVLMPLAIRTMAKAAYSTENIGHYGLAFDNYTHFTSPIRRYSDVLVHRGLFDNLKKPKRVNLDDLEMKCVHISKQERKAMEAERASVKYKQVEFMKNQIGKEFEGQINGMIDRGIFIELKENFCEGMVPFSTMNEPFFLESRYKAIGHNSGKVFKMGDTVMVKIVDADLAKRQIEMVLVD